MEAVEANTLNIPIHVGRHSLHIALVLNISTSASALFAAVQDAEKRSHKAGVEQKESAFVCLNPSLICGVPHLVAATLRALDRIHTKTTKAKSLAGEIIFALTPSPNLGEGFKLVGMNETLRSVAVLGVISRSDACAQKSWEELIQVLRNHGTIALGAQVDPLLQVEPLFSPSQVDKVFKLTEAEIALGRSAAVLTRVALKGV